MGRVRAPVFRVAIDGPSMLPTLQSGEWWLARRKRRIRPGDVVVLSHPKRHGFLVVKRAVSPDGDGWWVEGDNPGASEDSRQWGPIAPEAIRGVLWWRLRPWAPREARATLRNNHG